MKISNVTTIFLIIGAFGVVLASDHSNPQLKTTVTRSLASKRLAFTENQGQWPDSILFRSNAGGATMWFTNNGAYYQFTRRIDRGRQTSPSAPSSIDAAHEDIRRAQDLGAPQLAVGNYDRTSRHHLEPDSIETMMIKANFVGSKPQVTVHGEGLMEYKCNYFLGNDPTKWRTDVPNYSAIVYEDIYPGIDLHYSGVGSGQIGYEFIAEPGEDLRQVRVAYEGVEELTVDDSRRLILKTAWGDMIAQLATRPDGSVSATGSLLLYSQKTTGVGIKDTALLVRQAASVAITLVYSTHLGGSLNDYGSDITVDADGAAYVTGQTESSDFPTLDPYQTDQGYEDVFVTKLSASGNSLV